MVCPTVPYAKRLREVLPLFHGDLRVQVSFTVPPHPFGDGTTRYLRRLGVSLVPWREARRTPFDLALAVGTRGTEHLKAPLLRLGHGAGHNKPLRTGVERSGLEDPGARPSGMLSRSRLMPDGKLLPASLALSHERDIDQLRRSCPEALPVAEVVGDPSADRISSSRAHRRGYRRALGVREDQRLLVATSTWGAASAFGGLPMLLPQLLMQLPRDRYRVAVLLHPNVWAAHGSWQITAWWNECRRRGVVLLPPETDWETLIIAADLVLGDHGSLTAYTAPAETPILLTHVRQREVTQGSPADLLARNAPVLSPLLPLAEQVQYTVDSFSRGRYLSVTEALTSAPGRFHQRMRTLVYRMLGIGEPACPPTTPELPNPQALDRFKWRREHDV